MKEVGGRNIFSRKNYGPLGLRSTIAVLGFCLYFCSAEILSSNLCPAETIGQNGSSTQKDHNICCKTECYRTVYRLLNDMNPDVNPCDNFYKYACGGFINKTVLHNNTDTIDFFTKADNNMRRKILDPLLNETQPNDPRTFRLMRNLYAACTNRVNIKNNGLKPLHRVLNQLGGWPIIEGNSWNETAFDWVNVSVGIGKAGYRNYLMSIEVDRDFKDKSRNLIYISPPPCRKQSEAYYDYAVEIATFLGADQDRVFQEINDTLAFEDQLKDYANFGLISSTKRSTIDELSETFSWTDYFRQLFPASVHLNGSDIVNQFNSDYFLNLEKLITQTPKRVVANYLLWRVVLDSVKFLHKDIRQIEYAHASTALPGLSRRWNKVDECLRVVTERMPVGTMAMYVRNYFNEKTRLEVIEMINHIKKQLIQTFETASWMDEESRQIFVARVNEMEHYVGYFDVVYDNAKIDKFYESLEVSEDDYFNSIRNVTKFNIDVSLNLLRETINRTDWRLLHSKLLHSPFYSSASNAMAVLAPSLTNLVFHKQLPNYVNYARIGHAIGHEMIHSFSETRLKTMQTKRGFITRKVCLVKQYFQYKVAGQGVNGLYTFNENLADLNGVNLAYRAYKDCTGNDVSEVKLPSFTDKTSKQMFWLSYANFWCEKSTAAYSEVLEGDPHSPSEFRVNGVLSNLPEFSKDWNCPAGSNMNPVNKCETL